MPRTCPNTREPGNQLNSSDVKISSVNSWNNQLWWDDFSVLAPVKYTVLRNQFHNPTAAFVGWQQRPTISRRQLLCYWGSRLSDQKFSTWWLAVFVFDGREIAWEQDFKYLNLRINSNLPRLGTLPWQRNELFPRFFSHFLFLRLLMFSLVLPRQALSLSFTKVLPKIWKYLPNQKTKTCCLVACLLNTGREKVWPLQSVDEWHARYHFDMCRWV